MKTYESATACSEIPPPDTGWKPRPFPPTLSQTRLMGALSLSVTAERLHGRSRMKRSRRVTPVKRNPPGPGIRLTPSEQGSVVKTNSVEIISVLMCRYEGILVLVRDPTPFSRVT